MVGQPIHLEYDVVDDNGKTWHVVVDIKEAK